MAALFFATITYAPASTAAISSARIVGVWVRLFILESPRFYRSESNAGLPFWIDRKSTRLNSSHSQISYAVFCLKKKKKKTARTIFLKYEQIESTIARTARH